MSHTPGPWTVCNKGDCTCKVVWCSEHPIAEVVHGPWGDRYPSIKLVGTSTLDLKAEPFIDMIEYGAVDEEEAKANALLISASPNMFEVLEPFAKFAEHWDARPPGGLAKRDDDPVYTIHLIPGEPPCSITLGHVRAARAAIKKARSE